MHAHPTSAPRRVALAVSLLAGSIAPSLSAQQSAHNHEGMAPEPDAPDMGEMMGPAHHMMFTPARTGSAADTTRALALVRELRSATASYTTLEAAEAAGYRARDPDRAQRVGALLHAGRRGPRRFAGGRFDTAVPQALLYRRDAEGGLHLAGAMFVAPEGATLDQLDQRIPLGLAAWHRHLNVCRGPSRERSRAMRQASTPEACAALGGRFRAASRYMIHVMTDAGDDLDRIFPQGHQEQHAG